MVKMEWTLIVQRNTNLMRGELNRTREIVIIRIQGEVSEAGSPANNSEFTYMKQKAKAVTALYRADHHKWLRGEDGFRREPTPNDYTTHDPIRGWPAFVRFDAGIEEPE